MGADLEVCDPEDASVSLCSFAVQRHQVLGQGGKFGLFQIAEFGHGGAGGHGGRVLEVLDLPIDA